jgi:hypothetical protein
MCVWGWGLTCTGNRHVSSLSCVAIAQGKLASYIRQTDFLLLYMLRTAIFFFLLRLICTTLSLSCWYLDPQINGPSSCCCV